MFHDSGLLSKAVHLLSGNAGSFNGLEGLQEGYLEHDWRGHLIPDAPCIPTRFLQLLPQRRLQKGWPKQGLEVPSKVKSHLISS